MALLTPAVSAALGAAVTSATPTASTGDTYANTGREIVRITNGSGSTITVTPDVQRTVDADGATITDPSVSIAAGATKIFQWNPATYNDGNGLTKFTCSAVSSVTVEILRLGA